MSIESFSSVKVCEQVKVYIAGLDILGKRVTRKWIRKCRMFLVVSYIKIFKTRPIRPTLSFFEKFSLQLFIIRVGEKGGSDKGRELNPKVGPLA